MKNIFYFILIIGLFLSSCSSTKTTDDEINNNPEKNITHLGVSIQRLDLHATFHHIGIQLELLNYQDTINIRVESQSNHQGFIPIHPLSQVKENRFVGTVFSLIPKTNVDIRITLSDAQGTTLAQIEKSIQTKSIEIPQVSGREIHVAKIGSDEIGQGNIQSPYLTIQHAMHQVKAGERILIHEGIYYESIDLTLSGTKESPIIIQSTGNGEVIFDGADAKLKSASAWTSIGDNIYKASIKESDYVAVDGIRLWHYKNLDALKVMKTKEITTNGGFVFEEGIVYVRLPNDDTPEQHEIQVAKEDYALSLENISHIVIQGLKFRTYGMQEDSSGIFLGDKSHDVWIVNNTFENITGAIWVEGNVSDLIIMENDFSDKGSTDFSWEAIKDEAGYIEKGALFVENGLYNGQGIVFHKNKVHNIFDGIKICGNDVIEHPNNADISENIFKHISDYGIEADGVCSNVRIINNRFEDLFSAVSVAPAITGPSYIIGNIMHDLNNVAPDSKWETLAVKFNVGDEPPSGDIFIYHNTATTSEVGQSIFTITNPVDWSNVSLRNNIWQGSKYAFYQWIKEPLPFTQDYDLLYSTGEMLVFYQDEEFTDIEQYSQNTGNCQHCIHDQAGFVNLLEGNYTLLSNSPAIDKGVRIEGINDNFIGLAPDIGAKERKEP